MALHQKESPDYGMMMIQGGESRLRDDEDDPEGEFGLWHDDDPRG